jgi:GT2 family glycosyltransferase
VSIQAVIMMAGAVGLMVSTGVLVRRRMLSIRYGLGWLTVSLLGLAGAPLLGVITAQVRHLGFTATGFSLGVLIAFLGLICLQLSISVSGLHGAIQDLSEHAALVELRLHELEHDAQSTRTGDPPPHRVLLVIPALNEERSVGKVVDAGRRLGYGVCVVDDGSVDSTAERAADAGAHVLRLPVHLGVGGALRCGFRWALHSGYGIVVQVDADGQHDPGQVEVLLDAMRDSGADMVVGSRFVAGAGPYQVHGARRLAMRILSARVRRVSGIRIQDCTSGFRAIRRPLLDRFAADYPVEYLGDTVEALIEAGRAGAKIVEHPITMTSRAHGSGSAGAIASLWYVLRVIVAIELQYKRRNVPLQSVASDLCSTTTLA